MTLASPPDRLSARSLPSEGLAVGLVADCVAGGAAVIVVTGQPGSGKVAVLDQALAIVERGACFAVRMGPPFPGPLELQRRIARALGLPDHATVTPRDTALALRRKVDPGRGQPRLLLAVEGAEALSVEALHYLWLLHRLARLSGPPVQLLLMGSEAIWSVLAAPALTRLREAVTGRVVLPAGDEPGRNEVATPARSEAVPPARSEIAMPPPPAPIAPAERLVRPSLPVAPRRAAFGRLSSRQRSAATGAGAAMLVLAAGILSNRLGDSRHLIAALPQLQAAVEPAAPPVPVAGTVEPGPSTPPLQATSAPSQESAATPAPAVAPGSAPVPAAAATSAPAVAPAPDVEPTPPASVPEPSAPGTATAVAPNPAARPGNTEPQPAPSMHAEADAAPSAPAVAPEPSVEPAPSASSPEPSSAQPPAPETSSASKGASSPEPVPSVAEAPPAPPPPNQADAVTSAPAVAAEPGAESASPASPKPATASAATPAPNAAPPQAPAPAPQDGLAGPAPPSTPALVEAAPVVAAPIVVLSENAPTRVVLRYPRDDAQARARAEQAAQVLRGAGVTVGEPAATPRAASRNSVGYFFAQDRPGAKAVGRALTGLIGQTKVIPLPVLSTPPAPGTIEVTLAAAR